jgi:hypothetical protein
MAIKPPTDKQLQTLSDAIEVLRDTANAAGISDDIAAAYLLGCVEALAFPKPQRRSLGAFFEWIVGVRGVRL